MDELTGALLRNRYRVVRRLDEGGMGVVYLAEHRRHPGVRFALKVLKPHLLHVKDLRRRFLAESEILKRLEHPGIVPVYDCFDENGATFLVLAFIDGPSLGKLLRANGAMAPEVALPLFKKVLNALDSAHRAGVIHRDIKPSNILLNADGEPLLCDFGIARDVGQSGETQLGTTMGTPVYMSPEQIQAPQNVDYRSDLYSAGIVLYEMLTGKVPFGDDDTLSDYQVLQLQVSADPPDPRSFQPGLDAGLVAVLNKALRKDPDRRFQGGTEFREALERVERGGGGRADTTGGRATQDGPVASERSGSRRYAVYEHPQHGLAAVKVGWSWPALFFGPLWMLARRFYARALLWFAAELFLLWMAAVLSVEFAGAGVNAAVLLVLVVDLLIWLIPAGAGNRWRGWRLERGGYEWRGEVPARSAKAAVARLQGETRH